MLINTLQSLVTAGNDALQTTCGLPVLSEDVMTVRHGNLTFPFLGEIAFRGGTLQHLYLGCDAALGGHLAEKGVLGEAAGQSSVLETLIGHFLASVLEDMSGRRPQGWVENLEVGLRNLPTRGVRTFGFRFRTEVGNLYLMAEVPSRAEWEQAKGSGFLQKMTQAYLPNGWINRERLDFAADIENFLIFLRKTELDVQVDVPGPDETFTMHTGTLVESTLLHGRRVLRLTLDLLDTAERGLQPGEQVFCRVGLKERALSFRCQYLGQGPYAIAGTASVNSVFFSVPEALTVEQRRRAFRIQPGEPIPVEISPAPKDGAEGGAEWYRAQHVHGHLVDLSFSGAFIQGEKDQLLQRFKEGDRVICRLHFPAEEQPLNILGVIRRATIGVNKQKGRQGELGLEFMVTEHMDRSALEFVRQYVLSQQRAWLSRRIPTAGAL